MSFRMTCDIKIGNFKPVKASAFDWDRSVDNFSDSAFVKLPTISMLKKEGDTYERVQTGLQFKEGMNVNINAGYDGLNDLRFKGFVKRINFSTPLEVECEGYSYQLRKKLDFSKTYKNTTIRNILLDVIQGTDITLSDKIPNVPIEKATFQNVTALQVLEWMKDKCLLTVYFIFNELYVGLQQLEATQAVRFRLGWNVVKDSELKFNADKEFADVRIMVGSRTKTGERAKGFVGKKDGQVKKYRSLINDPEALKRIADQKRMELVNRGYEGSITAFLKPFVEPGMAVEIDDTRYPERKGKYFVTGVKGSFSTSGGRQKILIGNSLG